jgi:predicted RNase H-like nuclease
MFGDGAPVWRYLEQFGGPVDPISGQVTGVIETYPVLTMIALGWTRPHCTRACGRLPKYNPARKKTFTIEDWQHVCRLTSKEFSDRGLRRIAQWIEEACEKPKPRKSDQDRLDACICLLVALYLSEGRDCLFVGNLQTGYIVVPHDGLLYEELETRCSKTGRNPPEWIRKIHWQTTRSAPERPHLPRLLRVLWPISGILLGWRMLALRRLPWQRWCQGLAGRPEAAQKP